MRQSSILSGLCLALALAVGAAGEEPQRFKEAPALAAFDPEGNAAKPLRYQELLVTVAGKGAGKHWPAAKIQYRGAPALTVPISQGTTVPALQVRPLDLASPAPQVVVSSYSGGAHCCTVTAIATLDSGGAWHAVDAGWLDGDNGYRFYALDPEAGESLVSIDNGFLYAFDCYACSFAPTVIKRLKGTALENVTREPRYQPFLRQELRQMEDDAKQQNVLRTNGYLAGWVAQKILVGEGDEAWRKMLASYSHRDPKFPAALAKHLVRAGYLTEAEANALPMKAAR